MGVIQINCSVVGKVESSQFEPDELNSIALRRENLQLSQWKRQLEFDQTETKSKVARLMIGCDKFKEKLKREEQSHMKTKIKLQRAGVKLVKHMNVKIQEVEEQGLKVLLTIAECSNTGLKTKLQMTVR